MNYWVCMFLLSTNLACMPASSTSVSQHLLDLLETIHQQANSFSAVQAHFGEQAEAVGDSQFNVSQLAPCFGEAVFVQEVSSGNLSHIDLPLEEGYRTSLTELRETFGDYHLPPAIRRGAFSALFSYQPAGQKAGYTIIAKATEALTPRTEILSLTIRID
jgi:hypothetical protein